MKKLSKKSKILLIVVTTIVFLGIMIYVFCFNNLGRYKFTDGPWECITESDVDTLAFTKEGKFVSYCGCGDSLYDSDICKTYSYNSLTKTIRTWCPFGIPGDKFEVIYVDDNILKLEVNDKYIVEYQKAK